MLKQFSLASGILLAATVACAGEGPTTPTTNPPVGPPQLSGGTCGGYLPTSGYVDVDSVAYFIRDSASIVNCGSTYGVITPATGIAGFVQGSACTQTARNGGSIKYVVRGCSNGSVQLKIYNDSTQTTLLQTIPIDVGIQ
jgi:hypothetical protein